MNKIPLTILNGFLGAGKTTLLRHLLAQARQQGKVVAAIVNDMSELEVDGVLVNNNEEDSAADRPVVSIYSQDVSRPGGMARLDDAIARLTRAARPDHIVLETSGGSHPLPLIQYLASHPTVALKGLLVLVDAVMLQHDYAGGRELLSRFQANLRAGRRDVHNLLVEQMLFCSQLVLSRGDRLPAGHIERIARAIHPINPGIPILSAVRGNLRLEDLLAQPDYDFHRVARLIEELAPEVSRDPVRGAYGLGYRVIRDPRPFHPQRLWRTYHELMGQGIYRSKGFFWLPSRDDRALLWNQSSGSIALEVISYWKAGALGHADNRLTREEREALRLQVERMHPVFGDRRCELTVIGAEDQLDGFEQALRQCLLTEAEILQWQAGQPFDDPWPHQAIKFDA